MPAATITKIRRTEDGFECNHGAHGYSAVRVEEVSINHGRAQEIWYIGYDPDTRTTSEGFPGYELLKTLEDTRRDEAMDLSLQLLQRKVQGLSPNSLEFEVI